LWHVACTGSRLVLSEINAVRSNPPPGILWELGGFRMLAESRSNGGPRGGDFYTFALRAPTRLAVVIGDACGRGPDGAALLPLVLPTLDRLLKLDQPPSRLLSELNRALVGSVPSDRFVTAAAFELDTRAGSVVAACAAHVPTLLRSTGCTVRAIGTASGPPLGIVRDCHYADECHDLRPGDVAIFMTDGLLEALETNLLTMETLRKSLATAPAGNRAVHRSFLAALDRCTARSRADDALLLSLEVVGEFRDAPSVAQEEP
jgi:serine phosphatase RsbU (regulator of sigma subunit)